MGTFESPSDVVLAHYGVKGMKWGIRKDRTGGTSSGSNKKDARRTKKANKKLDKADRKWSNQFQGVAGYAKIQNAFADNLNARIIPINNSPKYKNMRSGTDLHKQYLKEYEREFDRALKNTAKTLGIAPSGRFDVKLTKTTIETTSGDLLAWNAEFRDLTTKKTVKHADTDISPTKFIIKAKLNSQGKIVSVELIPVVDEGSVAHGALMHYGVKGMKWGVRRRNSEGSTRAKRTTYKKQDLSQMSNNDIQARINRLNLEKQYLSLNSEASSSTRANGGKVVKKLLSEVGTTVAKTSLQKIGQVGADYAFNYGKKALLDQLKNRK